MATSTVAPQPAAAQDAGGDAPTAKPLVMREYTDSKRLVSIKLPNSWKVNKDFKVGGRAPRGQTVKVFIHYLGQPPVA